MTKSVDLETRAMMALARESTRMRDAAERVHLVVKAMALRRGVKCEPLHDPAETVSAIV